MKKSVLVLVVLSSMLLLIACDKKEDNPKGNPETGVEYEVVKEVDVNNSEKVEEKLGFSVEKGKEVDNIKYDTVFIHGDDRVQLDLILDDNGKIGTLSVAKSSESYSSKDSEKLTISDVVVSKVSGLDGIDSYYWEKEGFHYKFSTKNDSGVTKDDIAKIIKGYSTKVAEDTNVQLEDE